MNPFPPVIISEGHACLATQTYISSYPAKALALISPPASFSDVDAGILPTTIDEFNFEPRFPIGIFTNGLRAQYLLKRNRLAKNPEVELIVVEEDLFGPIDKWLDDLAI
jgi:hypothetical protein